MKTMKYIHIYYTFKIQLRNKQNSKYNTTKEIKEILN